MTRHHVAVRTASWLAVAAALALGAGAWTSIDGAGAEHDRYSAIVRIRSLGLEMAESGEPRVRVWASGPARVGIGDAEPTLLTDTLQLSSLPAITADVTDADVHIQLLSPGRMRLGAEVSGGRAIRFTATGRHVVVLKGGVGADTITDP